jgi:hypothetical protein
MKEGSRTSMSSESDEQRDDEKLNMLFYIKQMPKMIN